MHLQDTYETEMKIQLWQNQSKLGIFPGAFLMKHASLPLGRSEVDVLLTVFWGGFRWTVTLYILAWPAVN